ncbi:hypothetical protein LTR37_019210 [Vermiconidia calcicola]|uniref:Uncharacterized protein n=1 Tax=Vermiconidia calcicola TaxID=1690605 RepID=A0ACC3MGA5_9PEZI|nr:hypothetical protein LTR37_019210 [Vermiconidia calcicola]
MAALLDGRTVSMPFGACPYADKVLLVDNVISRGVLVHAGGRPRPDMPWVLLPTQATNLLRAHLREQAKGKAEAGREDEKRTRYAVMNDTMVGPGLAFPGSENTSRGNIATKGWERYAFGESAAGLSTFASLGREVKAKRATRAADADKAGARDLKVESSSTTGSSIKRSGHSAPPEVAAEREATLSTHNRRLHDTVSKPTTGASSTQSPYLTYQRARVAASQTTTSLTSQLGGGGGAWINAHKSPAVSSSIKPSVTASESQNWAAELAAKLEATGLTPAAKVDSSGKKAANEFEAEDLYSAPSSTRSERWKLSEQKSISSLTAEYDDAASSREVTDEDTDWEVIEGDNVEDEYVVVPKSAI